MRYADACASLEAILFASGDPLGIDVIAAVLEVDRADAWFWVDQLAGLLARDATRGLRVRRIGDAVALTTAPTVSATVARLFRPQHRPPLSAAAYETLAVVAYNKTATRAQIDAVRGVNSDSALARLIERGYVEAVGQEDAPGRATQFAVSERFLLDSGLASVDDLPAVDLLSYEAVQALMAPPDRGSTQEEDI